MPFLAVIWNPDEGRSMAAAHDIENHIRRHAPHAAVHPVGRGCLLYGLAAEGNGNAIVPFASKNGCGAIFGRLFPRRPSFGTHLPLKSLDADAVPILANRGERLITDYWGAYVAFLDCGDGLTVLTEPTSSLPCFYCTRMGVTLVFSHLEACPLPDWIRFEVDFSFITVLLAYDKIQTGRSGLLNVRELAGGCRLHISKKGSKEELLWDPRKVAKDRLNLSPSGAATRLEETVSNVVGSWSKAYPVVALNLSGGLDSAIVAACMSQEKDQTDLMAVHFILGGGDPSEVVYARTIANDLRLKLLECPVDPSRPLPLPEYHPRSVRPFREFLGRSQDAQYRRELGLNDRTIFTGQGGDHLFLETRDPRIFADYLRQNGPGTQTGRELLAAARVSGTSIWQVLAQSLPEILFRSGDAGVLRGIEQRITELNRTAHAQLQPTDLLPVWALEGIGLPPVKFAQVASLVHMIQIRDGLALPDTSETIHPLISQPLVELCLRLPAYLLCHGGQSRGMARRAFKGRVPDQVRLRRSKGDASRFYIAQVKANRNLIADTLLNGTLVSQGLIRRQAIEAALTPRVYGVNASGRMILVYYAIEAWLSRWT